MDPTFEIELVNTTFVEFSLLDDFPFNASLLPPAANDEVDVSLIHLVEKIQSIGISNIFKKLTPTSRNCVIAYLIMFSIGAPGNLYVILSAGCKIWKRQLTRSSRIKLLIWHLALADCFVTFVVIPIEIFWRLTVQWYGGNTLCKTTQFMRTFGLYLSSMVVICISVDRFCTIIFPLKSSGGRKRINKMLVAAWTLSILFAAPQMVVFSVQKHPLYPSFRFCSSSQFFPSFKGEILYNLVSLVVMYFAPLIVIIVTYAFVLFSISRKSSDQQDLNGGLRQSRSNNSQWSGNPSEITKAKNTAMCTSMLIVTVFVLCWTPHVVTTLWYMFDFETAERLVGPGIREALFVTAVSSSCLNPIIFGNWMKKCCKCIFLCGCPQLLGNSSIAAASTDHHNVVNSSVV